MWNLLLDTLFPTECVLCGNPISHTAKGPVNVCLSCVSTCFPIRTVMCPTCHNPVPGSAMIVRGMCKCCDEGRWGLSGIISIQSYHRDSPIRKLLLALKHRGHTFLARDLAFVLADHVRNHEIWKGYDGIVAVPLHPSREKKRGYNQASLLGSWLSRFIQVPFYSDVLHRTRRTVPQSGDPRFRRTNISGAFKVHASIAGARMILVDDVFTTGATSRECAREMIGAGCKAVGIATCAWAPPKHRRNQLTIKGEMIR